MRFSVKWASKPFSKPVKKLIERSLIRNYNDGTEDQAGVQESKQASKWAKLRVSLLSNQVIELGAAGISISQERMKYGLTQLSILKKKRISSEG